MVTHRRLPRALTLPAAVAMLSLMTTPATGQTIPTTPEPEPADPEQPPISAAPDDQPTGQAIGEAGTALAMLRLLPDAVPTEAILPGLEDDLPKQPALETGFGISSAATDSESYLSYERAVSEAAPAGLSIMGDEPLTKGINQTAMPNHEEPRTTKLSAPENPLVELEGLYGSAHARWDPSDGPCVDPIADTTTSTASASLLPVIPTMPDLADVTEDDDPEAQELASLPDSLASLGGLLPGDEPEESDVDPEGSLISVPDTLSTHSTVRLVDLPDSERKAVQSTSELQAADINLLAGTPLGLTIKVASSPTLQVTSTGEEETSSVEYTAPVLKAERDGETLFELDAANPTQDIPISIPLPGLGDLPGFDFVEDVPIIGDVVELVDGTVTSLTEAASEHVLNIGVLRLSIAELTEEGTTETEPFEGYQLGASARLLDLQILPSEPLTEILPERLADELPSSLAQVSLGEQVARAHAPHDGVDCGTTDAGTPPPGGDDPGSGDEPPSGPEELAQTGAAYSSVPLFWTGTGTLLLGVVLLAGFPGRRQTVSTATRPSPRAQE